MRIRRRLVLYAAGVLLVGMVIFGVLLNALVGSAAPAEQDSALAALAADTAASIEVAGLAFVEAGDPLFLADADTSVDPFVVVYADDGAVLYRTGVVGGVDPGLPAAVVVETQRIGVS
ncbi:MAG: hypothetical protein HKN01_04260, partial [Acidimicrobiia bacterium]|nr:hypothetical protein [Acidimicrobiia bacterium]